GPFGFMNSTEKGYENWLERYPGGNTTWANPLWSAYGVDDMDIRYAASIKAFTEIRLPWVEGLSLRVNVAYNLSQTKQAQFNHEEQYVNTLKLAEMQNPSAFLKNANGYSRSNNGHSWLINQILNYNRTFGYHKIDLTFLSERQRSHADGVYASASDFQQAGTTVLGYNALEMGNQEKRGADTHKTQSSQLAYMARGNYVYKNRYHASASYRRDGFSAFSEGCKFGDFFSTALAWTLTEEDFMKNSILNYLKLRLSYGENGNPSIDSYSTFPTIGGGSYLFGNETVKTIYQNKLANKLLGWERTQAMNVGLDFGFFNDRLTGDVEYYNSTTKDLLVTRRLPFTAGYGSILDNMGKIANWGIEISLRSKNIMTTDFSWETGLTFWMNRNKIKSLYGIDSNGDGCEDDDLSNGWFIGKPLGAIYNYTVDGIVQKEDTEYCTQFNAKPGDVKFVDISGPNGVPDGKIDATYDRSIIGYTSPNFKMNMSNTITYKNFQLYFALDYVNGGGNRYLSNNEKGFNPNIMPNANWINEEYWTPENHSNVSPRVNYNNSRGWGFYQSREFLRLQNVTFNYTLDKKTLDKIKVLTSAKVFVSGMNLLTITHWRGLDPEAAQRIGEGSPSFKVFSLGANISF
ncbi:MAG: SusC/RagA family TonB-linked outer membrane protein, partial [Lachnospiraceae bacterium]